MGDLVAGVQSVERYFILGVFIQIAVVVFGGFGVFAIFLQGLGHAQVTTIALEGVSDGFAVFIFGFDGHIKQTVAFAPIKGDVGPEVFFIAAQSSVRLAVLHRSGVVFAVTEKFIALAYGHGGFAGCQQTACQHHHHQ
ncbi:MAG: hypothetical protein BWY72_02412 [Bacteroidetes bacterium ADurb.Bin416]|nr:MAG: hypothetical protein BWY72_02412 [Bacteroidetes bacterium ADurb.Bin416]